MKLNLRSFKQKVRHHKKAMHRFLKKFEKSRPRGLDQLVASTSKEVWKEIDCLDCANCCKTMSPTYTPKDIKRIAAHLKMTTADFSKKYLRLDVDGDMMNKTEPCKFLNLENNYCSIYEVRPADCAGFPHHHKKMNSDYVHVYQQNVTYCPATYRLVEKMMEKL